MKRRCELRLKVLSFYSKSENDIDSAGVTASIEGHGQGGPVAMDTHDNAVAMDTDAIQQKTRELWASKPDSSEHKAKYEIGRLMEAKSQLQAELAKKDLSLTLWKKKEREYQNEVKLLRRRMDEMARVIRSKETEIDHMKYVESQHLEEIRTLNLRLKEKRRPGLTDPTLKQIRREIENSPIPTSRCMKLPTLVKRVDQVNEDESQALADLNSSNQGHYKSKGPTADTKIQRVSHHVISKHGSKTDDYAANGSGEKTLRQPLPPLCVETVRFEEWINSSGGRIHLPHTTFIIPPRSLHSSTFISVSQIENGDDLNDKIAQTNLQDVAEHATQFYMEPHGVVLNKDIYIDMANGNQSENMRYLVFQKVVDRFERTLWHDVTNECSPRFLKSGALRFNLKKLSAIQVVKLSVPFVTLPTTNVGPGYAIGKNAHPKTKPKAYYDDVNTALLGSILNGKLSYVDVSAYHDQKTKCLILHVTDRIPTVDNAIVSTSLTKEVQITQAEVHKTSPEVQQSPVDRSSQSNRTFNERALPVQQTSDEATHGQNGAENPIDISKPVSETRLLFLNKTSTRFPLCDKDRLYFYFDGQKKWQLHSILNLDDILNGSRQTFKLPRSNKKGADYHSLKLPKQITITRRIADRLDEQVACILNLTKPRQDSSNSTSSLTSEHIHYALSQVRIKVVQTVDIRYILDLMREAGVFSFEEQREIREEKTPQGRAKCFLEKLQTKGPPGVARFCSALEADYGILAQELKSLLRG